MKEDQEDNGKQRKGKEVMTPSLEEGRGGPHATMGPKEEEEEKIILHVWSRREMERGKEGTSSTLDEDEEPQWDHTVVIFIITTPPSDPCSGPGIKAHKCTQLHGFLSLSTVHMHVRYMMMPLLPNLSR